MSRELLCSLKLGTPPGGGMVILKRAILTVPTNGLKFKNNTILKNGRNNNPPIRGNKNRKLMEAGTADNVYQILPQSVISWNAKIRQIMTEKEMIDIDLGNLIPPVKCYYTTNLHRL